MLALAIACEPGVLQARTCESLLELASLTVRSPGETPFLGRHRVRDFITAVACILDWIEYQP
jgi:hypothetical protein